MKGNSGVLILIAALAAASALVASGSLAAGKGDAGKSAKAADGHPLTDSASLAAGAKTYTRLCVTCHGALGKGDGPGAASLKPKPRNFTDPTQFKSKNDEEIFKVVQKGGAASKLSPAMPAWGGILKPDQIWQVIAYVHTLAKPAAKPAPGK